MTDARNAIIDQFSPGKKVSFYHDDQWWWGIVKHVYKESGPGLNTIGFRIVPGDDNGYYPEGCYMSRKAIKVYVVARNEELSEKVHKRVRLGWIEPGNLPMPNY